MGRRVLPLVALLLALGVGGAALRSWLIGYPLVPRLTEQLWEARVSLQWREGQAPVSLLLPLGGDSQEVQDERIVSGSLEAMILAEPSGPRRLRLDGADRTTAEYRALVLLRRTPRATATPDDAARWLGTDEFAEPARAAATRLKAWLGGRDVARGCFDVIAGTRPAAQGLESDVAQLRGLGAGGAHGVVLCWRASGLPARVVQALPLRAGFFDAADLGVEVFDSGRWILGDPARGRYPVPARTRLLWARGTLPLAQDRDGAPVDWRVELLEQHQTLWAQFFRQTAARPSPLTRWSLYALPLEMQEVFRVLLLVPIGALVVAVLRNVVGFATFGTFMPILLAIAFRQTELLYGLGLFAVVVGAGYVVRLGVERYKLLLVPRLSVILTFVIGALAALSVLGYHLGLRNVLAVGLLPMVILTMTIERFHVVTEEAGARAAFRTAASTAAVAAIAYGIISLEYLQLLFFTYPELLFAIAGAQLALGRYVGYRLTELWRFKSLAEPP